jgi:hypothetical protein
MKGVGEIMTEFGVNTWTDVDCLYKYEIFTIFMGGKV